MDDVNDVSNFAAELTSDYDCLPDAKDLENETPGSPCEIVEINDQGELILNEKNFEQIVKAVGNAEIAVISIAGAFRRGKSFLLNVFLRYLCYSRYNKLDNEWLENCWSEPFRRGEFFVSESNVDSVTKGVRIWSQPLFIEISGNRKLAVLVMDSQGLFDGASKAVSSKIFCLSSFVSSWQIVNIGNQFDETDAENLHAFTEYGASLYQGGEEEGEDEKLFPELTFLIRDWQNTGRRGYGYGFKGGNTYWKEKVKEKFPNMHSSVSHCFKSVKCCLMPHPGRHVVEAESFSDIDIAKAEDDFVKVLEKLAESSLAPSSIPRCKDGGKVMTAQELYEKFKIAVKCFQTSDDLVSFVSATAQLQHQMALDAAFSNYDKKMKTLIDPELYNPDLREQHDQLKEASLLFFKKKPKSCQKAWAEEYQKLLEERIEEANKGYQSRNDLIEATARIDNQEAFDVAMNILEQGLCLLDYSKDRAFLPKEEVERIGKEARNAAKKAFDDKKSHKGGQRLIEEYEEKFTNAMDKREGELTHHAFRTEEEVKERISNESERLLKKYKEDMTGYRKENGYVREEALKGKHHDIQKRLLADFEAFMPMQGGQDFRQKYLEDFKDDVEDALKNQLEENKFDQPFNYKEIAALAVVGGALIAAGPVAVAAVGAIEVGASVVAFAGAAGSLSSGFVNWAKPRWARRVNPGRLWRNENKKEKTE